MTMNDWRGADFADFNALFRGRLDRALPSYLTLIARVVISRNQAVISAA
ncbi:hypothetical protein [Pannonibacter phragmitetus]|nr:hypothetical protein [Pannonibacter phragmitetus]